MEILRLQCLEKPDDSILVVNAEKLLILEITTRGITNEIVLPNQYKQGLIDFLTANNEQEYTRCVAKDK